uniref:Serine/threonine-protein kinase HT1 n=1 Tax=Rhizophora mucronata TaxID=61149 RepID=A0A2P2JND5_RHIMU
MDYGEEQEQERRRRRRRIWRRIAKTTFRQQLLLNKARMGD